MATGKRQRQEVEEVEDEERYCSYSEKGGWTTRPTSPLFNIVISEPISLLLNDPELLDCPICFEPLRNVIYQCENGHIACSPCSIDVGRKCGFCSEQITFNRCRAMEKLIESLRVECPNKTYGCKEALVYLKKAEHEKICPNMACYCPIPLCGFVNSSKNLYLHFSSDHSDSATLFSYYTSFSFDVEKSQKYVILQERNEGVIFILKHSIKKYGRAFSIDCIGPPTLNTSYKYQLCVKCNDTCLSLESGPEVYAEWEYRKPSKNFLIIPVSSLEKSGRASVQLCVKKVEDV